MKNITMMALAIALAGCGSVPVIKVDQLRALPANEMQACPSRPPLRDRSFGASLDLNTALTGLYDDCAKKHKDLIEWVLRDRQP